MIFVLSFLFAVLPTLYLLRKLFGRLSIIDIAGGILISALPILNVVFIIWLLAPEKCINFFIDRKF
jgi:hypothetical protein